MGEATPSLLPYFAFLNAYITTIQFTLLPILPGVKINQAG